MIDSKKIEQIARQIHDAIPKSIRKFSDDIEKKICQIIQTQLIHLNVISREEFDVQTQLLSRSYEKISCLERRLIALEKCNMTVNRKKESNEPFFQKDDDNDN